MLCCGAVSVALDSTSPFCSRGRTATTIFVRRKRRKSVANGEIDVRLPGHSIHGLARKLLGRAFCDPLRVTECLFVVGEPVEHALLHDRHHDLDRVGVPDVRAQNGVCMLDRADDENIPSHEGNVSHGRTKRPRPSSCSTTTDEQGPASEGETGFGRGWIPSLCALVPKR